MRYEDYFIIEGVPLIPDDVIRKAWQDLAMKHVQEFLRLLTGKEMETIFVCNASQPYREAPIAFYDRMSTVSDSCAIRKKFGTFFRWQGSPTRTLQEVCNRVTPEKNIRIAILQLHGKK